MSQFDSYVRLAEILQEAAQTPGERAFAVLVSDTSLAYSMLHATHWLRTGLFGGLEKSYDRVWQLLGASGLIHTRETRLYVGPPEPLGTGGVLYRLRMIVSQAPPEASGIVRTLHLLASEHLPIKTADMESQLAVMFADRNADPSFPQRYLDAERAALARIIQGIWLLEDALESPHIRFTIDPARARVEVAYPSEADARRAYRGLLPYAQTIPHWVDPPNKTPFGKRAPGVGKESTIRFSYDPFHPSLLVYHETLAHVRKCQSTPHFGPELSNLVSSYIQGARLRS